MMRFVLVSTLAATVALGAAAQTTDDTKRNENVARHFFESSNRNDIEGMLSDLTGDAKNFGRPVGREGFRMVLNDIFTTFPDWMSVGVHGWSVGKRIILDLREGLARECFGGGGQYRAASRT